MTPMLLASLKEATHLHMLFQSVPPGVFLGSGMRPSPPSRLEPSVTDCLRPDTQPSCAPLNFESVCCEKTLVKADALCGVGERNALTLMLKNSQLAQHLYFFASAKIG